ncbi:phosphatidylglycerophosphatase A family protein [Paraburkholderia dinghuensis]|uniref:Phosphatidylglycerophosphatase A n=1 Tax=Paraburkholderia dinghuensis TaxID=2305225 RepID=A0A3N6MUA8_9BURK|nr:phosphatidylglycerophosphatase A [Paraburkholderia dinghuensis]RQG99881.1 phosphatidylglycerophosphatase A [Paraburkholderia dinghuensis]
MQTDPTPTPADDLSAPGHPAAAAASGATGTTGASTLHASTAGPRRVDAPFMLTHPFHLISLGFGSGLSRIAPGTAGTLFAWASFEVLNRYLTVPGWGLLIVVGYFAGIAITSFTAKKLRADDPSAIVWDEIVAFWLVLLMVTPVDFTGKLGAFIVFRFFDIVKPPPIRHLDRRFKGGFGIMLDDLVAAFFTLLVIALWRMSV